MVSLKVRLFGGRFILYNRFNRENAVYNLEEYHTQIAKPGIRIGYTKERSEK